MYAECCEESSDRRTRRLGEKLLVDLQRFGIEADEPHYFDSARINMFPYRVDRNARRALRRKMIDARADCGERYASDVVLPG